MKLLRRIVRELKALHMYTRYGVWPASHPAGRAYTARARRR